MKRGETMTVSEISEKIFYDDMIEIYYSDKLEWYGKVMDLPYSYYVRVIKNIIPCIILNRYIGLRIIIK